MFKIGDIKLKEKIEALKNKIREFSKSNAVRRNTLVLIAAICIVLMAIGGIQMLRIQMEYRQGIALYEELTGFLSFDNANDDREQIIIVGEDGEVEETFTLPPDIELPRVDFDALREINPNIIGWIILEGTPINYPVVQGSDNDFYLTHLFDGTFNPSGAIFMDYLNNPNMTDPHTLIYGHHMQNGSMFAAIELYVSQAFYEEHPFIFYITPERDYVIKPFTGYTTDVWSPSWQLEFDNDAQKESWIAGRRARSDFASNTTALTSHRFVTLTTCSMTIRDARYVLTGILMPVAR
jgi:sortase B